MQNNFEKDVRQKMDELKLTPSATVWERVETEIKDEKKKRYRAFWFLLAALLLLSGGWWAYRSAQKGPQDPGQKAEEKAIESSSADQTPTILLPAPQKNSDNTKGAAGNIEKERKRGQSQIPASSSGNDKEEEKRPTDTGIKRRNGTVPETPAKIQPSAVRNNASLAKDTSTDKAKTSFSQATNPSVPMRRGVPVLAGSNDSPVLINNDKPSSVTKNEGTASAKKESPREKDSLSFLPTESKPVKTDTALASTDAALKKKVAAQTKKWRKEISLSIGRSSYVTGGVFGGGAAMFDAATFNNASGGSAVSSQSPLRYTPVKTTGGAAFSFGYLLSRPLSSKFEIAFGLQYVYASTRINVGDKKTADTTVSFNAEKMTANGFYTNTAKSNYTNHFHSLELPLRLSYQPSAKLPLLVSMSMAYGYLVSTNALTFSPYSNLYYRNKNDYKRRQLPLSVALQWRSGLGKGKTLQAGPVVQYNLGRLQAESSSAPPHLFFAGILTALRL